MLRGYAKGRETNIALKQALNPVKIVFLFRFMKPRQF